MTELNIWLCFSLKLRVCCSDFSACLSHKMSVKSLWKVFYADLLVLPSTEFENKEQWIFSYLLICPVLLGKLAIETWTFFPTRNLKSSKQRVCVSLMNGRTTRSCLQAFCSRVDIWERAQHFRAVVSNKCERDSYGCYPKLHCNALQSMANVILRSWSFLMFQKAKV